jgi:hypothetical protein
MYGYTYLIPELKGIGNRKAIRCGSCDFVCLLFYRSAHGADAVWVSNHGGRQLDGAASTLVALPEVVAGVAGRVPVLFDGAGAV